VGSRTAFITWILNSSHRMDTNETRRANFMIVDEVGWALTAR